MLGIILSAWGYTIFTHTAHMKVESILSLSGMDTSNKQENYEPALRKVAGFKPPQEQK